MLTSFKIISFFVLNADPLPILYLMPVKNPHSGVNVVHFKNALKKK